jgi:CubicO group peptidase (beta-lactamase class C family)
MQSNLDPAPLADVQKSSTSPLLATLVTSATLFYRDDIIWSWNGGMNNNTHAPPTGDSVYRIGSVSKVFPWLLALIAEQKGLIHMEDPITNTVPELQLIDGFHSADSGRQNKFTWRQLASHLAGMPREAPCRFVNCDYTTDEMLNKLKSTYLILPPQTRPSYSNLGFALLGRLLADKIFKAPYEGLIQQYILNPLGMSNTGFVPTSNTVPPVTNSPFIDMKWSGPAGQMFSSANDLAKLSLALNHAGRSNFLFSNPWNPFASIGMLKRQQLDSPWKLLGIPDSSIRQTFFPTFLNPDGSTGFSTPWEYSKIGKYYLRNKAGFLDNYSSTITMIPELQLGMTVTSNYPIGAADVVSDALSIFIPPFESILDRLQQMPPTPFNSSKYTGTYISPEAGNAETVIMKGFLSDHIGIVRLLGGLSSIPLVAASFAPNDPAILQVYVPEANLPCMGQELSAWGYATVHFQFDSHGNVLSFTLPTSGFYGITFNKIA